MGLLGQLPGGQRQRIGIARAIAGRPELVLCDEPVSALDVSVQAAVLNLLMEIQQELDTTMIFIAHDLSVVRFFCDTIAVMYLGRIVEIGSRNELFSRPHHPYTQALLRSIPKYGLRAEGKRLDSIRGMVPDPYSRPEGCPYHPRCDYIMPGKCDRISPPPVEIGEGRVVRCLLYDGSDVSNQRLQNNSTGNS